MFAYHDQQLSIVHKNERPQAVASIVGRYEGPTYVYDLDGVIKRLRKLQSSFRRPCSIHYAVKANFHPILLKAMADEGIGADVVSKGEFQAALTAGIPGEKIVFSGVGKTVDEIRFALMAKVKQLNVESLPELVRVAGLAAELGVRAPIALRMNPDVDAETHPYIRTGFRENKFGLDFSELDQLLELIKAHRNHLDLKGLTLHIGSQIRQIEPFQEAIEKTLRLHDTIEKAGFELQTFDIGGGLGIDYQSGDLAADERLMAQYVDTIERALESRSFELLCEPGRFLVARFGILVTEIQYIKETPYKTFVIVDAGMNHLMRPALYQAFHRIVPLTAKEGEQRLCDIVGPICESSDVLGYERLLPVGTRAGDLLAIMDAGAYGAVMASRYNLHTPPREVVVSRGHVL